MDGPNRSQPLPNREWCNPDLKLDWNPFATNQLTPYLPSRDGPLTQNGPPSTVRALEDSGAAAHAVGQLPELVELILSFASESLLYSCLFVCKAYSSIAKKYIWRELPEAIPLLSLLGPIITTGQPNSPSASWVSFPPALHLSPPRLKVATFKTFRTPPTTSQWENFNTYAKYVKIIAPDYLTWSQGTTDHDWPLDQAEYSESSSVDGERCCSPAKCPISDDALAVLLSQDKEVPHLHAPLSAQFPLAPSLELLTFTFGSPYAPATSFLPFIGPQLAILNLLYHVCLTHIASDGLIRRISESLRALAVFFSTYGPLPVLQRLQICLDNKHLLITPGYEAINEAILEVLDGCTQLRYIQLPPFSRHEHLLSKLQKFTQLTSLTVSFRTSAEMTLFAEGLVSSHLDLRRLRLAHNGFSPTPIRVINPLLKLRNLTLLSIKSYSGMVVSPNGLPWSFCPIFLRELSDAWPNLESLILRPSNYVSIQSLESFQDSNIFPRLTSLALSIDNFTQEPPTLKEVSAAVRLLRPLQSLHTLAIDTPWGSKEDTQAIITYAERIGSSKAKILLNGSLPGSRSDSW
ncbi:hypothetical protein FRC00_005057 [Tulasnella sp. 408]|nr:hypothetical protein FRC00_005057 [Tulasnella sp. 408]